MNMKKISIAAVSALLLAWMVAGAVQAASSQVARRGADDAAEGGHRSDNHQEGATAPAGDGQGGKGKALFEEKCSVCHGLDRPLGKTKNRSGWTTTVKRMQQVNGCPITDGEAGEIINYLVKVRGPAGSRP
jgi:cytochrome c5